MTKPINAFFESIDKQATLTPDIVKSLFLETFEGKRVLISYDPQRQQKKELATKLICRGFNRGASVEILRNTFSVSKTSAYAYITAAINNKYNEAVAMNGGVY